MAFLILVVTPVAARKRRRVLSSGGAGVSRIRQMRQVLIDRAELFIAHSSDWLPRHFLAEFMSVGINAGTHRGEERR